MFNENDSQVILGLINFIKTGNGIVVLSCFVFFTLFLIKGTLNNIVMEIFHIFKNKNKTIKYSLTDLRKHPIFSAMDFWLEHGIETLSYVNNNVFLKSLTPHEETPAYVYAKEEMAKEIIKIKISTMRDILKDLINKYEWNTMSSYSISYTINSCIQELNYIQYKKMFDAGIPKIFVQKFVSIDTSMCKIFTTMLESFTHVEMMPNIDGNTRVYLGLNAINAYMCTIFNSCFNTILNINGDLVGMTWKGKVIESNILEIRNELPPIPVYDVEEKVTE